MVINQDTDLEEAEDTRCWHVLARLDGLEAYEGNLHSENGAEDVEGGVGGVESGGESSDADEDEDVQRNEVDDKNIPAPRGNHVEVREGAQAAPHHTSRLHRLHPQEVRRLQSTSYQPNVITQGFLNVIAK